MMSQRHEILEQVSGSTFLASAADEVPERLGHLRLDDEQDGEEDDALDGEEGHVATDAALLPRQVVGRVEEAEVTAVA